MFVKIRKRYAPKKHVYVERPAYIITERELSELEEYIHRLEVSRRTLLRESSTHIYREL